MNSALKSKEIEMKIASLRLCLLPLVACAAIAAQNAGQAQSIREIPQADGSRIIIPLSSIERPEDRGLRSHTHFLIHVPAGRPEGVVGFTEEEFPPDAIQPVSGEVAETPASLACLYELVTVTAGCDPKTLTKVATGGSKAVAIVDAYDYPTALADLTAFSKQFGLPAPIGTGTKANFTVVFQTASNPGPDPNCAGDNGTDCWASESSLDIDMVHSAAPLAHIYLVEANSSSNGDLYAAVTKAIGLVQKAGGGEVSMSWGGAEYPTEAKSDPVFTGAKVVLFASTGDNPGIEYPSTSPNVVAVGGTTISRNPVTLDFQRELAWESGGGGFSIYEAKPAFQDSVTAVAGKFRGVPDVSAIANPNTGVWIYDNYQTGGAPWIQIGGTSAASPFWAGAVNSAGSFEASSKAELTTIYGGIGKTADFRDISDGACGFYDGYLAVTGWDPCTGVGAPLGKGDK
jgi:subtilase family serine protease